MSKFKNTLGNRSSYNNRSSCDDEQEITLIEKNIFSKPIAFQHDLYLTDGIGSPEEYNNWIQVINSSGPNDSICIHINSPGGVLDSAIQIYGALCHTEASVSISVEGGCCSGASIILMSADHVSIDTNSYFLFHAYSGGDFGKFNNLQENAAFQSKWFPSVTKEIYKDFLTDEEIDILLSGRDIWMNAHDVTSRFERLTLIRQARMYKESPEEFGKLVTAGVIDIDALVKAGFIEDKSIKKEEKKPAKKKAEKKASKEVKEEKDESSNEDLK